MRAFAKTGGNLAARLLVVCGLLAPAALLAYRDDQALTKEIGLPQPHEWSDHGIAIPAGLAGSWDIRLSGALSPATVVKQGDTYFLYYIGADGDREAPPGDDGGPRHRALGLATSRDGVHFTKHPGNPVITFIPTPGGSNAQEEGVFSATALYDTVQVTLYFGGMTMVDGESVRIDVYQTTSGDGFAFAPPRKVLDGKASTVWGNEDNNDEVFPAGLFQHDATWNLYYLTKNRAPDLWDYLTGKNADTWDYGMVSGPRSDRLDGSRQVLLQNESMLGGEYRQLSAIKVGPDRYALFLVNYDPEESQTNLEVRMVSGDRPDAPGPPQSVHTFSGKMYAVVFLDEAAGTWFMYYRDDGGRRQPIRVKTAPVAYERR
jgi:hypothetical protein